MAEPSIKRCLLSCLNDAKFKKQAIKLERKESCIKDSGKRNSLLQIDDRLCMPFYAFFSDLYSTLHQRHILYKTCMGEANKKNLKKQGYRLRSNDVP